MIALIAVIVMLIGMMCVLAYTLAIYALPFMLALAAMRFAYGTGAGWIGAGIVGIVAGLGLESDARKFKRKSMKDKIVIGADIGGTNTTLGLVNGRGEILSEMRFATRSFEKPQGLVQALSDEIRCRRPSGRLRGLRERQA